jgi:hypothetical protein
VTAYWLGVAAGFAACWFLGWCRRLDVFEEVRLVEDRARARASLPTVRGAVEPTVTSGYPEPRSDTGPLTALPSLVFDWAVSPPCPFDQEIA